MATEPKAEWITWIGRDVARIMPPNSCNPCWRVALVLPRLHEVRDFDTDRAAYDWVKKAWMQNLVWC